MLELVALSIVTAAPPLSTTSVTLPGGAPVGMDYYAWDAANHRLWVPAGNTGNVDVVDVATLKVTAVSGFPTAPSPRAGRPNMGPSSATVGDGVVWFGNRGDNKLCAVNAATFAKGACVQLPQMPDGLAYVASTGELWATTPRNKTVTVVDLKGKEPAISGAIPFEGEPEGYAVDDAHGLFFTNLEDKDKTLAVDIKTRKVVSTWSPGCGEKGPRGLALDAGQRLLFVACTDGAVTLDVAHDGKVLGRLKTGSGVDNIDYSAEKKLLYVASGEDGMLTFARVEKGTLTQTARTATAPGARAVVIDSFGAAWVADSRGGKLIVIKAP